MSCKLWISGAWVDGRGAELLSEDPATQAVIWRGRGASVDDVAAAVNAARLAAAAWARVGMEKRAEICNRFAGKLAERKNELAELICREVGKPLWESNAEVESMRGKVAVSIEAQQERRKEVSRAIGDARGVISYKPHGVVAVLGPFNFPGHLPNGHIVPALLAGNTVVFKPSELTPAVGEMTAKIWEEAGLPAGVLNLVQGGRETGQALVTHSGIDGVFFTGSFSTGRAINRMLADEPGKIVALEMGGNNPLVVHRVKDRAAAAMTIVQSAFITSGQRCSCARRLIVTRDEAGAIVRELIKVMERIIVGPWTDRPEPFMGPVISAHAADQVLHAQEALLSGGGKAIVPLRRVGASVAMLSPGLIDVTDCLEKPDTEVFGPLLQMIRVKDLDEAIAEANRTSYGLAAGLLSDDAAAFERFLAEVRAGVINFNRPLTGASAMLPFGGVGRSGNHRPSAYFAADYCSYPVASLESDAVALPAKTTGFR